MDDVDNLLEGMAQSTVTEDNEFFNSAGGDSAEDAAQHPRFGRNYKNEGEAAARQRERRQEHLQRQTLAREDWLKRRREIEDDDDESMARRYRRKIANAKRKNPYRNMMMFSDWLIDIPGTLSTEWTMLASPVGRRTLVVARNGETRVYFRNGCLATSFPSLLPGANAKTHGSLTILDAIMDESKRKLFLLDLLWWNNRMYTDIEFTARRFFLQSRIEEVNIEVEEIFRQQNLQKIDEEVKNIEEEEDEKDKEKKEKDDEEEKEEEERKNKNKKKKSKKDCKKFEFVLLPSCVCSPEEIGQFVRTVFPFRLDGLLFYYNSAFYLPEQTPLVGWLKPWMLPEILGVPVPELYMEEMVHGCSKEFIEEFNRKYRHISSAEKAETQRQTAADAAMDETVK